MQSKAFLDYVKRGCHQVPGMLQRGSLFALWVALDAQADLGIEGNCAEIGVYRGKLFTLLGLALRDTERSIGIDLFTFDKRTAEENLQSVIEALEQHAAPTSRCQLHTLDSQSLNVQTFAELTSGRSIRFFSVDGDHSKSGVRHDLNLAAATTRPEGLIVVDDLFNIAFPGVTEGILAFLEHDTDEWEPFALSAQPAPVRKGAPKLFLAHRKYSDWYRLYFRNLLDSHFVCTRDFAGARTITFEFDQRVSRRELTEELSRQIKQRIGMA